MAESDQEKRAKRANRVVGRLRTTWDSERAAIRFDRRFESWRERFPSIAGFNDVEDLIAWHQDDAVDYEQTNPVTIALCLLAQDGDQAAAALLYFLFVPWFIKFLGGWKGPAEVEEAFDEMLGGFAEGMLTVSPEADRAARHITGRARGAARNLQRRGIRRERREAGMERIAEIDAGFLGVTEDLAATDPEIKSEWHLIDAAVRENVIKERQADLIRAQLAGYSLEGTAQVFGTTYKAAAEMRRRARRDLAGWLLARQGLSEKKVQDDVEIAQLPALLLMDEQTSDGSQKVRKETP